MNTKRSGHRERQARASVSDGDDQRGPLRRWAVGLFATAILAMILPANPSYSADEDQVHEVTWAHLSPSDVRSFVIFISPVAGSVDEARQVDVGKPGGSGSGSAQFFSALVSVGVGDFVAVAAVGRNGLLSDLSGWSPAQPSQPGQPLVVEP